MVSLNEKLRKVDKEIAKTQFTPRKLISALAGGLYDIPKDLVTTPDSVRDLQVLLADYLGIDPDTARDKISELPSYQIYDSLKDLVKRSSVDEIDDDIETVLGGDDPDDPIADTVRAVTSLAAPTLAAKYGKLSAAQKMRAKRAAADRKNTEIAAKGADLDPAVKPHVPDMARFDREYGRTIRDAERVMERKAAKQSEVLDPDMDRNLSEQTRAAQFEDAIRRLAIKRLPFVRQDIVKEPGFRKSLQAMSDLDNMLTSKPMTQAQFDQLKLDVKPISFKSIRDRKIPDLLEGEDDIDDIFGLYLGE